MARYVGVQKFCSLWSTCKDGRSIVEEQLPPTYQHLNLPAQGVLSVGYRNISRHADSARNGHHLQLYYSTSEIILPCSPSSTSCSYLLLQQWNGKRKGTDKQLLRIPRPFTCFVSVRTHGKRQIHRQAERVIFIEYTERALAIIQPIINKRSKNCQGNALHMQQRGNLKAGRERW